MIVFIFLLLSPLLFAILCSLAFPALIVFLLLIGLLPTVVTFLFFGTLFFLSRPGLTLPLMLRFCDENDLDLIELALRLFILSFIAIFVTALIPLLLTDMSLLIIISILSCTLLTALWLVIFFCFIDDILVRYSMFHERLNSLIRAEEEAPQAPQPSITIKHDEKKQDSKTQKSNFENTMRLFQSNLIKAKEGSSLQPGYVSSRESSVNENQEDKKRLYKTLLEIQQQRIKEKNSDYLKSLFSDKKIEDKKIEDKKIEDKKIEDKKIEDKKIERLVVNDMIKYVIKKCRTDYKAESGIIDLNESELRGYRQSFPTGFNDYLSALRLMHADDSLDNQSQYSGQYFSDKPIIILEPFTLRQVVVYLWIEFQSIQDQLERERAIAILLSELAGIRRGHNEGESLHLEYDRQSCLPGSLGRLIQAGKVLSKYNIDISFIETMVKDWFKEIAKNRDADKIFEIYSDLIKLALSIEGKKDYPALAGFIKNLNSEKEKLVTAIMSQLDASHLIKSTGTYTRDFWKKLCSQLVDTRISSLANLDSQGNVLSIGEGFTDFDTVLGLLQGCYIDSVNKKLASSNPAEKKKIVTQLETNIKILTDELFDYNPTKKFVEKLTAVIQKALGKTAQPTQTSFRTTPATPIPATPAPPIRTNLHMPDVIPVYASVSSSSI